MLSLDMNHNSALIAAFNHNSTSTQADSDLNKKIRKTCDKVTENLYVAANEPLLGCYRIQEHVAKTVPTLLNKMIEMEKTDSKLRGLLYDVEYSNSSIGTVRDSKAALESIEVLLKRSIYLKQQIDYDNSVRKRLSERAALEQRDRQQNQEDQSLDNDLERKLHLKESFSSAESSARSSINQTTGNSESHTNPTNIQQSSRHSFASNTTNATKNAFNRFSTSFDFRNFPVSDLRNDFKSFISQFTGNNQRPFGDVGDDGRHSSESASTVHDGPRATQAPDCQVTNVKSDILNSTIEDNDSQVSVSAATSHGQDKQNVQTDSIPKQT